MQVWIANPFDALPAPGVPRGRYAALRDAFAAAGHDVVWWSASWSHLLKAPRHIPPTPQPPLFPIADCGCRISDSSSHPPNTPAPPLPHLQIRLLPVRPYHRNIGLARLLSHRDYARALRREGEAAVARGELPPPHRVIAARPPLGVLAQIAPWKSRWRTRLGLDLMDAWPEAFDRLLPSPIPSPLRSLLLAPFRRLASRDLRLADRISAVGQTYLDIARPRAPHTPTHLCYHGTDWERFAQKDPHGRESPCSLLHLGALNDGYDLLTPLETLTLPGAEHIHLHYAGRGTHEKTLQHRCRVLGLQDRVHFHGQLDADRVASLLQHCTVGLVTNRPSTLVACPYKAADYAAAGLPILSCLRGEFEGLLQQHHLGICYSEGDPRDLLHRLQTLLQLPPPNPASIRPLFDRSLTYPRLVEFYTLEHGLSSP